MNYTLRENNAGGLLLVVTDDEEVLMLTSFEAEEMSEYLHAVRNGMLIDSLRDMATVSAEVDTDDYETYRAEWEACPVIADNNGMYRDRAGVAGETALRLCALRENAPAELERCETAEAVRDLVVNYPEAVTADIEVGWWRYEFAEKICRLVYGKIQPETFAELQHVVQLWDDICRALIDSVDISIAPYYSDGEDFRPTSYEEANTIEMRCERVDLHGSRPYDLARELARMCEGELMKCVDSDQDEDSRWFYFEKK